MGGLRENVHALQLSVCALATLVAGSMATGSGGGKPHIVMVCSDDLGFNDGACAT